MGCSAANKGELRMNVQLPLDQMSFGDKMDLINQLWVSVSKHSAQESTPEWQREVLRERLKRFEEGKEELFDLDEAVDEIERELDENSSRSRR
jgi:Putative addiction module component